MNYLYGSIAIILVLLGVEQYGEHRTQVKWDLETARLEAIAKKEKENDRKALDAISEQHRKDIQNAKSEAGRAAVAAWLKSNGLLYSKGDSSKAEISTNSNGTSCESGTTERIKEFADRCRADAAKVELCTQWAIRENLELD